ncbi:MAG: AAA family ATPase [Desulfobacteraceae bacterium]|nr:AAA family ATPase [Desulfobacteraceae bacterium]
MQFILTVKNFGKIEEAKIQVKNLTVLAGPNNSGKSFVSKALYSFFKTMNTSKIRDEILSQQNTSQIVGTSLKNELKGNFQVAKLKELSSKETIFSLGDFAQINLSGEDVFFSIKIKPVPYLDIFQNLSHVIYLESPIYLKLKSALGVHLSLAHRHKYITGVPDYFYALTDLLTLQSMNEPEFIEVLHRIEKSIGGQLKLSNEGNFVFQDDNGTYSVATTALGVANLGLLALLLEKNLLDSDSFLFIDEPEAHLHPQWQVVLIEVLYELAKAGVNIMIATHSLDMIKYLEVIRKKDELAESLIALNCLTIEGKTIQEEANFETKLNAIKQELSEPFYNLYLEAL